MGIKEQGAKPTGLLGKITGRMMNQYHTSFYIDVFKNRLPASHSKILDIGCGGGRFLKFLANKNETYFLYGLDHSPEMVALSKRVNKKAARQGRMEIIQGSVTQIPHEGSSLDLVTAFETVQFWPDIGRSFSEIYRVLKAGGNLIIINRYPPEGSTWWETARIKSSNGYIRELEQAGFRQVITDLSFRKGWIIVVAEK